MTHTCPTCQQSPLFSGWDACLQCGVAATLVEDPCYLDFARRVFKDDAQWLAALEQEWSRQANALASSSFIRLTLRQAS